MSVCFVCFLNSFSKHFQALSVYLQVSYTVSLTDNWKEEDFPVRHICYGLKKKVLFLKCQLLYDKNHLKIYEGEIGKWKLVRLLTP